MRIDARLQVLYLVAVGTGLFLTARPSIVIGLLALQVLLWILVGLPLWDLVRGVRRLASFFVVLVASYAFFPEGAEADMIPLAGSWLALSPSSLWAGVLMSARILTIIYASMLINREGRTTLVEGLRGLGLPVFIACALDITLALLTPEQRGRGMARGRGGGGGGAGSRPGDGSARVFLKRLVKGDTGALLELLEVNLDRAKQRAEQHAGSLRDRRELSDLAVVSGLALISMSLKFLKVMPGIPIAPGHKGVIFIPLHILAAELTYSRWGSTKTGFVLGVVAFLMGDGRFGIFEVAKYVTSGLVADLAMPLIHRTMERPGPWIYAALGLSVAIARFSTIVLVALLVQAPSAFYALLAPIGIFHCVFGFASGFVTFHLMKSVDKLKALVSEPSQSA